MRGRRSSSPIPTTKSSRRRDGTESEDAAQTIHTGRIVPVYEKTGTVTPKMQRRLVYDALQRCPPTCRIRLPEDVRLRLQSAGALRGAPRPRISRRADAPIEQLNAFATPAQQRLIFEEAFLFQMGV